VRLGNRSSAYAPHGLFPCRGEDQWCAIAVRTDDEWRALTAALGLTELAADSALSDLAGRKAHEDEIEGAITAVTSGWDKHALAETLCRHGLAAGAVQDGRDVYTDPELQGRHYVRQTHSVLGDCLMPGPPMTFSDMQTRVTPFPLLGEHNHEVFVRKLGMTEAEVAELAAAGALA
jgi:benzylsuccinate CoA-transferase BbsF subunit